MNQKKHITFLIVLLMCFHVLAVKAQEIKGDTVYVNTEAEVLVRFPTLPNFFNTVPSNAPYNFKTAGTGFTVIAKEENSKSAPLTVSEGGRTHHFVLVFKKNINYDNDAELDYDYSSVKKLEQHIKESKSTIAQKIESSKAEDSKTTTSKVSPAEQSKNSNYYALLEQGENNYKKQLYQQAKVNFEKARALRPDDILPQQMIDELTLKIADQAKSDELEKNAKYVDITSEAKAQLELKEYAKAKEGYKKALQLRPGDLYAKHQIEKIDNILQEEKGKKEQEKLKSLYDDYVSAGEKALSQNLLTDARIAFQQALVIKENDPVATNRITLIDEKEKKEKENENLENTYANSIRLADNYFQKGDYDNAGKEYTKANNLINRQWPQEQLRNIDKLVADKIAKQNEQRENIAKLAEAEKKERENAEMEKRYSDLILLADQLFKAEDYANAKNKYTMAADVIRRPWPNEQINKINSIIADIALKEKTKKEKEAQQLLNEQRLRENQEIEKNYENAIQLADKYYENGELNNAISAYNKAMIYIKKAWPEDQIKKINQILTEREEQKKKEKLIAAQQAATNSKYRAAIGKADIEFDKSNYTDSRKYYIAAAGLKPDENHPRERLLEIENTLERIAAEDKRKKDSISAALEMKRKYDYALSIAKTYYSKGDLENAKTSYLEALSVKPGEQEPKNQLSLINKKLEEIAKEKERIEKYENSIAIADSLLIAKEFEPALKLYYEATQIDSSVYYPKSQIKYIQSEIVRNRKMEVELRARQIENDFLNSMSIANKAIKDKKFDEAKSAYSKALKIHPDNGYALQRFKIAAYQYELQKKALANDSTAKDNNPAIVEKKIKSNNANKEPARAYTYQENPIPYSSGELEVKYPDIDFFKIPAEQLFNEPFFKFEDHEKIFKEMLPEKPRLSLSATENNIKLICTGINYDESLVYFKFVLQNNSKDDFLTGPMILTWTRKNGTLIKLYPLYLYPANLPIVKPGNETTIIYVCKSYIIVDQDHLQFEITDRLKKTKLQLDIPGAAYNMEMDREYK